MCFALSLSLIHIFFNNYEGVPYEGIALYKLTVGEDVRQAFLQWERFPLPEAAEHFLESLSAYVELPSICCLLYTSRCV